MKKFKEQLVEEGTIFIHNFIMVITIMVGYQMLLHAPDLLGQIIGGIILSYGIWLFVTAMKKGIDETIKTYFPHILKQLEDIKNKKGEN